jgi:hypothetical protein
MVIDIVNLKCGCHLRPKVDHNDKSIICFRRFSQHAGILTGNIFCYFVAITHGSSCYVCKIRFLKDNLFKLWHKHVYLNSKHVCEYDLSESKPAKFTTENIELPLNCWCVCGL